MNRDLLIVFLVIGGSTAFLGTVAGPSGTETPFGISIVQFLINGVVVGSIYILGATGLSLIFGIRKFANFAHGEMMTFGAYMAFMVNTIFFLDILWGFVVAIAATAVVGIILELLVFRKLAGRGPVSALVASIGITIFLNNLINGTFGTSIHVYNLHVQIDWPLYSPGGVPVLSVNPVKGVATLVVSVALVALLHILLSRTTLGKAMRATADNPDLARASGINTEHVVLWTWGISGALAGVAGVLLGIVIDVRPGLGFSVLLFIFAAVIVGGIGSPYGAMLGGLLVGIAQELSVAMLDWFGRASVFGLERATAYKPVAAFVIMILVLLLRPGGLAGGRTETFGVQGALVSRISRARRA